ncbi:MAG: bifunctional precorrin-2 dehydrogenase/sirohydrochlorin ferrochelatase [bacterium]
MRAEFHGWMPLWVKIGGCKCVVVGAGSVALRKINLLVDRGASVHVIAKEACQEVEQMAAEGIISLELREVDAKDLQGARLVVVATDIADVNSSVSRWAEQQGILCNVVDQKELCSAVFPAILKRGRLEVAVSTGGASPAMAARLRDYIGDCLFPGYEILLDLLTQVRLEIKKMGLSEQNRLELLRNLVDAQVMDACKSGNEAQLRRLIEMRIKQYSLPEGGKSP